MDLTKIKKVYAHRGRKSCVNPVTMLEILIFCYSEGIYSSRKIEKACKYDVRLWYLLDDEKAPDHSSINRFRQKITKTTPELLTQMISILQEDEQLDLSSIYIDGTKIESNANKYSFVWRKSVEKNQEKLRIKIIEILGLNKESTSEECKEKNIKFVYGRGNRKHNLQRKKEQLEEWSKIT